MVFDPHHERTQYIEEKYSVDVARSTADAVADADLVVFAVKPQNVDKVCGK